MKSAPKYRSGTKFEDILRAALAREFYAKAHGNEDAWLAARMQRFGQPSNSEVQHVSGDRLIKNEERRTADGGCIVIRTDVTDLMRREASFRLLFENNPVPMFVCDNISLRIVAVNEAAPRITDMPVRNFSKRSLFDLDIAGNLEIREQYSQSP